MDQQDEIESVLRKVAGLRAQYEALSPEEREAIDKLFEENKPYFEFLSEIGDRLSNHSMSTEEAAQWLDASRKEFEEAHLRRMRSEPETAGE